MSRTRSVFPPPEPARSGVLSREETTRSIRILDHVDGNVQAMLDALAEDDRLTPTKKESASAGEQAELFDEKGDQIFG